MSGFTFKQFHVEHSQCAMKVGTDGILLGAWADVQQVNSLLDMGTGTGLIALMLAQRTAADCQIQAVELEPNAYAQAKQNIAKSQFAHKIQILQQDIISFCQQTKQKFDLIVANPPYFSQGVNCKSDERNQARYIQQSHQDWLSVAENCLAPQGKISFILPFDSANALAESTHLHCIKQTAVITKQGKTPQRMLITFSRNDADLEQTELVIYDQQNRYTPEFIALTQDFYLNF